MARELTDRTIIITGASAGIGAAAAIEAARAGMHVVLAARREDRLNDIADQVRQLGRQAVVVPTDVADLDQVQRLVDRCVEQFDRLDVMFANAGYGFLKSVVDTEPDMHQQIFQVNYFGTVHCVQAAAPVMRRQGFGHILITSSVVARVGLPFYGSYSATKAAQDALGSSLRVELEKDNIDVTTVYPAGTSTEFFEVSARIGGRDTIKENTPKMFMQTAEHVARRVVKALRRPALEVWPNRLVHWGVSFSGMFPRLTRMGLRAHAKNGLRRKKRGH